MKKIGVTGSSKLAGAIIERFKAESLRIELPIDFKSYDIFINNAHVDYTQSTLLFDWFKECCFDSTKTIINISSRAGLPNISKGYLYSSQKAALDQLADNLTFNSYKKCKIVTLNLGMLEDELPSLKYEEVCNLIEYIINLPNHIEMSRVVLQHSFSYKEVQELKSHRY